MESSQIYLLPKTFLPTKALKSPAFSSLSFGDSVPATSGNPTDGGVSGNINQTTAAMMSAIAAGMKKDIRQFGAKSFWPKNVPVARKPPSNRMPTLPMLCDEFQMENLVASCLGGNQFASSRAQGGKPMP